ncbi:creatininase family protein [Arsenicitalea aurantiaca]|uniref:creatininase family protein n=1 Tax=Arsenicitalea aurantiaca TaxID=1783274 RepID=UPI0013152263|nr:creatininase family protein [Arsenicitalea aurantiaca]
MATYFAEELTAPEFRAFVTSGTVGVLPLGAIEPHGPHLPLSTDCDIARGHLAQLADYVAPETDVLILPLQTIGHSLEHRGVPGTFTHRAELLLEAWGDLVDAFHRAGGRRLVMVSSHGGNSEIMGLLATRLRVERQMLAVSAGWLRFGQPSGLFEPNEIAYGIHGGAIETSLMLHYWPEAVRMERAEDFASAAPAWEEGARELRVHGRLRPGWASRDLHPEGVVGNAAIASAEKGARSARHALLGFGELIADIAAFDLARLATLD